jgi:dTMP kinase
MENLEIEFHRRVRAGYLAMAAQEPARWLVLDAAQSVDAIHLAIRTQVLELLGKSS